MSQPSPPSATVSTATRNHAFARLSAAAPRGGAGPLFLADVALGEAARRPVRLRGVAPTRAMQGCDVLKRDQDVPVELDVGDVLDRAVRSEHSFLIIPAEQGDVDLLALVLVRVVLHEAAQSTRSRFPSRTANETTAQLPMTWIERRASPN